MIDLQKKCRLLSDALERLDFATEKYVDSRSQEHAKLCLVRIRECETRIIELSRLVAMAYGSEIKRARQHQNRVDTAP